MSTRAEYEMLIKLSSRLLLPIQGGEPSSVTVGEWLLLCELLVSRADLADRLKADLLRRYKMVIQRYPGVSAESAADDSIPRPEVAA